MICDRFLRTLSRQSPWNSWRFTLIRLTVGGWHFFLISQKNVQLWTFKFQLFFVLLQKETKERTRWRLVLVNITYWKSITYPPPIGVFRDKAYDASRILSFVMKRFVRQNFEFLTLLQLATASCGRAFLCLCIALTFMACSTETPEPSNGARANSSIPDSTLVHYGDITIDTTWAGETHIYFWNLEKKQNIFYHIKL